MGQQGMEGSGCWKRAKYQNGKAGCIEDNVTGRSLFLDQISNGIDFALGELLIARVEESGHEIFGLPSEVSAQKLSWG
jgi:hypothetical protein